ncbi:MAG: hypothetical protein WCG31_06935 [Deltaproteobacteria bacterium]|jgi:hypothetical protein
MLTIKDSHHISTNRSVAGHRACRSNTGFFLGAGESRRVNHEIIALANRRIRFAWLIAQWARHEEIVKTRGSAFQG